MKKIALLILFLICSPKVFALEEIQLEAKPLSLAISTPLPAQDRIAIEDNINPELDLFNTPEEQENKLYTTVLNTKNLARYDAVKPMLEEPLTQYFNNGALESLHEWAVLQLSMTENIYDDGYSQNKYSVALINALVDGKFRGGKEGFRIMFDPTPVRGDTNFFQTFIQDMYLETKRIPHHTVLIGNSRPAVGHEGSLSPYVIPFWTRAQISRHFGTARKFGLRVHGDYSFINYDLGALSSDTNFTEFFPGAEFDGWVNVKPLERTNGKYGNLTLGGGIVAGGRNSQDFFVAGTYIGYEYRKFWVNAEYACANGSNGATGLSDKKRQGWYTTIGYHISDKIEIMARYDEFDNDRNVSNNNRREFSAGINYYIKGLALLLSLNYAFCQNDNTQNSHRIILGTQIAI